MPALRNLPPDLPPDLRAALDRLATGVSRKDLAARAAAQSTELPQRRRLPRHSFTR
jgi:hypothetical protein